MKPTVASGRSARAASSIPRPARRTGTKHTGREISSTSVSASGVLMRTVFVGIALAASATMMRASSFVACLNSGVLVFSSRKTASFWRANGRSTTWRFVGMASRIQRISLRQCRYPLFKAICLPTSSFDDYLGDLTHLLLAHPARSHRGRPEPDAARYLRRLGVVGDHVLVARDPDRV